MLKINLLPPYINQRSKIRTAWTMLAALLVLELVGLTIWQASKISKESSDLAQVQQDEAEGVRIDKLASDAVAKRNEIAPIKEKTDFINQLMAYNKVRPDLYEHVASYIYKEVWISGMQAEQNVLTMPASANSISAVGRFLLFMQNSPDFTKVQISSVPGWPPGTAGVEAGSIADAAGGGGGATGGGMMRPGGPPGYGGPPGGGATGGGPGYGGPPGGMTGGGPPGYGGGEAGAPPIFGGGATGGGAAPGLMQAPGQDTGAITQGGAPIPYLSAVDKPKPVPVYFGFTVTGLLEKPIVRPSYAGIGAEGETGGGPGYGGPAGYGTGGGPGYGTGGGPGYGGPPGGPPGGTGGSGPYGSASVGK
jgi:hypothetical protein